MIIILQDHNLADKSNSEIAKYFFDNMVATCSWGNGKLWPTTVMVPDHMFRVLLDRRLFGGRTTMMDYLHINNPTTLCTKAPIYIKSMK